MLRMIVIDREARDVYEKAVDDTDSLSAMQQVVGGLISPLWTESIMTPWNFDDYVDTMYVNDEGLLSAAPAFSTIAVPGLPSPLVFAGSGVIVGLDFTTGDTVSPYTSVEYWKGRVEFISRRSAYLLAHLSGQ